MPPQNEETASITQKFTTQTVTPSNSIVDDKLSPNSEMHILVGGPYTTGSEVHRYGHTALRIKTKTKDITYDFGRYGATSGVFGQNGEGILRVWSDFRKYISGEKATGRVTTGFVYAIFDHQAQAVYNYFEQLINSGIHQANKDRPGMTSHKLTTDYAALGPNCTTLSIDGAKVAIDKIDKNSNRYIDPSQVLTFSERAALNVAGGANRLFLPANLQSYLLSPDAVKSIRIDKY